MLIDQLRKAVEGTAADKDLSAGMLNHDLCFRAKDRSLAVAKGHHQLSEARAIASEKVVRLWNEGGRKDSEKAARAAASEEKKKQDTTRKK